MEDPSSRRSVMDALDRMSEKLDVIENEQSRMHGRIGRLEDSLYGEKPQLTPAQPLHQMVREEHFPEQHVTFIPSPQSQPTQDDPVVYPPLPQKTSSWQHRGPEMPDNKTLNWGTSGMQSTYQSDYTGCYGYVRETGVNKPSAAFSVPPSGRIQGSRVVVEDLPPME